MNLNELRGGKDRRAGVRYYERRGDTERGPERRERASEQVGEREGRGRKKKKEHERERESKSSV